MAQNYDIANMSIPSNIQDALTGEDQYGKKVQNPLAIVKKWVEENSIDVNAVVKVQGDCYGYNLFHKAVMGGDPAIVSYLKKLGADLSINPIHEGMELQGMIFWNGRSPEEHAAVQLILGLVPVEDDGIVGADEPADGGSIVPYDEPAEVQALGRVLPADGGSIVPYDEPAEVQALGRVLPVEDDGIVQ